MTDNELIAEFMGAEFQRKPDSFDPDKFNESWIFKGHPGNWRVDKIIKSHMTAPMLCYDVDWDWLMPVVEKITTIPYEAEEVDKVMVVQRPYLRTFGMIDDGSGNYMVRFNRCALHTAPTLIEATYKAVVEFIKWYNENKPDNEQSIA